MNSALKIIVIFLAITGGSSLLINLFGVDFGRVDYWGVHGTFFLVFITLFPRLTLLFSSVASGGFFWWLGWLFAPRLLVAVLATIAYWNTNQILVVVSWLVALGGESAEKYAVRRRVNTYRYEGGKDSQIIVDI